VENTAEAAPAFDAYTKTHWSVLLYIETVVVDHYGIPDDRRVNTADYEAVETLLEDGLLEWGGTGLNPIFSLTDAGWSVAHAVRRARADYSRPGRPAPEPFPRLAAQAARRAFSRSCD